MADQWRIRLTKCGAGFILRFVVPELSFLKWKQVYAQISPKEIWKAFMWGNERSAAYFWRIKGKLLRGKKKNGNGRFRVQTTLAPTRWHAHTPLFVRTGPLRCAQVAIYSYGCRCTQMAIRTRVLTYVHILRALTYQTVEGVAVFLWTDCSSLLKGQAPLTHRHARTCARAHMHMGLMRAGAASGLTFLLPSPLWQLWSFLFMHSQTQRGRERGRDERGLDPIIVMYSLADIQLDSTRRG